VLSRRQFVKAAMAAGAAAAVPSVVESFMVQARAATAPADGPAYFFDAAQWSTCRSLCARIVPTGSDPTTDPGATEAWATVFIDRFLGAFELPASVADGPPIWFKGRWSGRNPFADTGDGEPTDDFPADAFLSGGQGHFLPLTPAQTLSWQYQLYGTAMLATVPSWAKAWAAQVESGLIASPTPAGGLRQAYVEGLAAFDSWSRSLFGTPYSGADTEEQDLMLELAGNVVLGALTSHLPAALPAPAPPPAATALFPIVTLHTFQATYGVPEYAWRNQANDPTVIPGEGTAQWRAIDYDGDTQPLGNSLFDENMYGPGQGPNEGFGAEPGSADEKAGVFVPFGGYRELRPVSTPDGGGLAITGAQAAQLKAIITGQGVKTR
jgi:hypothetical protein